MLKYWGRALALLAISILCTCVEAGMMKVIDLPDFTEFFSEVSIFCLLFIIPSLYILCICFIMIAIVKEIKVNASAYLIFACTDGALAAVITMYALYDMFIDTNIPCGFLGPLLLGTVVRAAVWLLILDMFFWLCDRLKKKYKENMEKWEKMHPMD